MRKNEFMIWYYEQKNEPITYELAYDVFGDDLVLVLDNLSPFFNLSKDKIIKLNSKYAIGYLDIKKSIAFLVMPGESDYKIELYNLNNALNRDLVLANISIGKPMVLLVIKPNLEEVVAEVSIKNKSIMFIAKNLMDKEVVVNDIPKHIVDGLIVLLKITETTKTEVHAEFIEVIGHKNDPDIETLKIIYEHGWPHTFSDELLNELSLINIDPKYERSYRKDLTNLFTVTIDGEDAKDLDDAISLTKNEDNTYLLGVHIADVSYYVKEGSLIDKEAYNRTTSVYLADRVIPMLPHKISNDLCSLNPKEDKYAVSCLITLNHHLDVIDYEIVPSIINTNYRLSYNEVNDLLKHNKSLVNKNIDDMIFKLNEISNKLTKLRNKQGSLDFQSSELQFEFKDGKIVDVFERESGLGEMLIESLMILANEVVGKDLFKKHLPNIYRVHDKPDLVKLENALMNLSKLGFKSNVNQDTPKMLQQLIKASSNTNFDLIVNMILLRSMQKAKYSPNPIGHFGLASPYYSHFTAPIRRYSDLLLHRMIREFMFDKTNKEERAKRIEFYKTNLEEFTEHISVQERVAITIERDVVKLKSCEYLKDFIGTDYDGIIMTVMPSGFFVKISNGIEGFVNVANVDDYLIYNEDKMMFHSRGGRTYRLGDRLKVQLIKVDMNELKIDFTVIIKKSKKKDNKHRKPRRRN